VKKNAEDPHPNPPPAYQGRGQEGRRVDLWKLQSRAAPYLFVSPFVVIFCVFQLYPLGRSLYLSFHKTAGARHAMFVGWSNYRFLLGHDLLFGLATLNTLYYTVAFLVLQIPLSLGLAVLLNSRQVRFRRLFRFSFFSSYLVGQVFVGVIFYQLFSANGLVNELLGMILRRAVQIPWLTSPNMVMPSILIASLWLATGYGMVYFLAALQAIDPGLYEAAAMDGAGSWSKFFHVTLPGIRPMLAYMVLVGAIGGFQLFELPFVLLQGAGPDGRGMTIVMYLFIVGFSSGDLGYASAIGWTLVAILVVISLVRLQLFRFRPELSA
jgi:ABC-type sugar transport system permease subunit